MGLRMARPRSYLYFEKQKVAVAAAEVAAAFIGVLPGLGANTAPVAPLIISVN